MSTGFRWRAGAVTALGVVLIFAASTAAMAQSSEWQQLSPAASPPARAAQAMAFDATSGKLVMFGGFTDTAYLNDTWLFDGTTWVKATPRVSPPPRAAATMAYDAVTGQVLMFGGYNGQAWLGDTWAWDGSHSKWIKKRPKNGPAGMTGPMGFQDPLTGHAAFFGGYSGRTGFYSLDTWEWTGRTWTKLVTNTTPYARAAGMIANDLGRGNVVLYGGLGDVNPINTWTFDGTDWRQENPTQQPDVVYYSGGAWDPGLGMVISFGGGGSTGTTWAWTGSDWTTVPTSQNPPARESLSVAYDPALGHVVLFGGEDATTQYNDTWQFIGMP